MHLIIRKINKNVCVLFCVHTNTLLNTMLRHVISTTYRRHTSNLRKPKKEITFLRDDMMTNRVDVYAVSCSMDANYVSYKVWLKCNVDIKFLRYQTVSLHMFPCNGRWLVKMSRSKYFWIDPLILMILSFPT